MMARKGRGDRDWRKYERDWKGYERYRRDEVNLFIAKAKNLVESNPEPWTPGKMGQPPYPPKAMVILLLLKTWLGIDYRSISAYLRAFPEQRLRIGLKKTPSHTSIRNHMLRLPEPYLRRLNTQLTKQYQKGGSPLTVQASAPNGTRPGSTSKRRSLNDAEPTLSFTLPSH
jgi:hypothetical protein